MLAMGWFVCLLWDGLCACYGMVCVLAIDYQSYTAQVNAMKLILSVYFIISYKQYNYYKTIYM